MYYETLNSHDCCGCFACEKICGTKAITMKENEKGFFYPVVDENKCVHCGLCAKVCPMEKNYVGQDADPAIYAAACRNTEIVKNSSSGGIFSMIYDWVLAQGGTAYGAVFDENFMVRHVRAETAEEAEKFRGSKYVESTLEDVYSQAEADLRAGKTVLLSGTPCQISALNAYLSARRVPEDKLYTVDVLCHGVPSRKVWKDYLNIIQNKYLGKDNRIVSVNMRSKHVSWEAQELRILPEKGNIDEEIRNFSFNKLFLSLNLNRDSCFNCRYTSYKRSGDISLSDFWNYKQANLSFQPDQGISEVLVNTEKGRQLLSEISEKLNIQEISRKDSWQPHLEYSSKEPGSREAFWNEYLNAEDSEKEQILRKNLKGSLLTRIIHLLGPILRKTGLYTIAGKLYRKVFGK